jgi:hypothetical protein
MGTNLTHGLILHTSDQFREHICISTNINKWYRLVAFVNVYCVDRKAEYHYDTQQDAYNKEYSGEPCVILVMQHTGTILFLSYLKLDSPAVR